MEKENVKRLIGLLVWLVIGVLVLVMAFSLYGRFKPNTLQEQLRQEAEGRDAEGGDDDAAAQDTKDSTGQEHEKIMAPDFTLEDIEGRKVKLSDYRGKTVFLNFWATWCPYCVQEMPDLDKANKELMKRGDAVVITVAEEESAEVVKKFMEDNKLSLPALMDYDGKVGSIYGVSGIPVTFVIKKDGSVYGRIPGATDYKTIFKIADEIK